MRRGNEPSFLLVEDKIVGVNLGSDFTAEHEMGIQDIKKALGIPEDTTIKKNWGSKGRAVTAFDERMFFFETRETHSCFVFNADGRAKECAWDSELSPRPEEISSAWSDDDFGIVVVNRHKEFLQELYEAFQKKDVAIWLGGASGPMANPGLLILIASRVPEDVKVMLYNNDKSQKRLQDEVVKTNIHDILKKAGKRYYALSPKWINEEKTEIIFWLNPMDQRVNNYGWFTIQDLIDWSKDGGPVPKNKK